MPLHVTAFLREQLARVERFADSNGWQLQRKIEDTPERNCNGIPVERFFPTTDEYDGKARKLAERAQVAGLCEGCPVADECLAGALLRGESFGGWGGVAQPDFQELSRVWRRSNDPDPREPGDVGREMCPADRHDTYTAYSTGCRCPDAREANRLYKRNLKAAAADAGVA